jgi:FkbM family methyltransferase
MLRPSTVAYKLSLAFIRAISSPLPARSKVYVRARLLEDMDPVWRTSTGIQFYCAGLWPFMRSAEHKRIVTDWIDGFGSNAVFWDIGANVGVYTLYAASKGTRVMAFEPEAESFALLQRNVDLNGFQGRVAAFNLALSNRTGLANFELADTRVGTPNHQIRDCDQGNGHLRKVMMITGRDASRLFQIEKPTHVKIDVDGFELAVMRGLDLADETLREVQVELRGTPDADQIREMFSSHGYRTHDPKSGKPGKVVNVIFRRERHVRRLAIELFGRT